jgi:hypothetical protein
MTVMGVCWLPPPSPPSQQQQSQQQQSQQHQKQKQKQKQTKIKTTTTTTTTAPPPNLQPAMLPVHAVRARSSQRPDMPTPHKLTKLSLPAASTALKTHWKPWHACVMGCLQQVNLCPHRVLLLLMRRFGSAAGRHSSGGLPHHTKMEPVKCSVI